jgi:hypothetical protein
LKTSVSAITLQQEGMQRLCFGLRRSLGTVANGKIGNLTNGRRGL